jgi:DnaJ homolog subfamily C member 27
VAFLAVGLESPQFHPLALPVTTTHQVNFWDLSGHPEFLEVRNEFYKDTQGAILAFDVGRKETMDSCEKWLQEAKEYGMGRVPCILVGTKVR